MSGKLPYSRCMTTKARDSRIEFRLTAEQKSEISEAAELSGLTTTAFVQNAAITAAREAVRQKREIELNKEAWAVFERAVSVPAQVNPKLARLLARPSIFDE